MRPNFLIIGAQKAGTTSLINYLSQHPDVFVLLDKEYSPYYIGLDLPLSAEVPGSVLYKNYKRQKLVGNAPVNLLYFANTTAKRIFTEASATRLIAILRNPIDRAYSAYCHFVSHGQEHRTFEDALQAEEGVVRNGTFQERANFTYLGHGLYYEQLARFFEYFDRSELLILLHDDLRAALHETLKTIFRFLEIEPLSDDTAYTKQHNVASRARFGFVGPLVFQNNPIKTLYKKIIPESVRSNLRYSLLHPIVRTNRVPYKYPPMNSATRNMLRKYFLEPNHRLQELLDRDISHWNH